MLTSSIPLGCQDHLSNLLIKRRTVKLVVKFFPSRISILHLSLYWFPKHFLAYNVLLYTLLGVLPGPLASLPSPPLVLSLHSTVADLDLQIRGGGRGAGHPDPEIRGGPVSKKIFFSVLRASVWSKNKGGPGPAPAPLPWIRHCSKHSRVAVSERLLREQKRVPRVCGRVNFGCKRFFLYLSPTPLTLVLLSTQLWCFVRIGQRHRLHRLPTLQHLFWIDCPKQSQREGNFCIVGKFSWPFISILWIVCVKWPIHYNIYKLKTRLHLFNTVQYNTA